MKSKIRTEILDKRNALSIELVKQYSSYICERLLKSDLYRNAKTIFTYVDFNKEVKTTDIIQNALAQKKRILIPCCVKATKQIAAMEITSLDQLERNHFGILEPAKQHIRLADRSLIDIAIVPGAAFDKNGNRLGYGAGYYDRFFNTTPKLKKVALAYSIQVIDKVEADIHDVPMDIIITEKEFIYCSSADNSK